LKNFAARDEDRLPDPSEIYAFEFKGKFGDSDSAWFQRLSPSIGRFVEIYRESDGHRHLKKYRQPLR
jgi:hypothetical protein